MSYDTIDAKLNAILELLKPKWEPEHKPVEEWEDVTKWCESGRFKPNDFSSKSFKELNNYIWICEGAKNIANDPGYRLRKIDGMHNGPAFIVERRKS